MDSDEMYQSHACLREKGAKIGGREAENMRVRADEYVEVSPLNCCCLQRLPDVRLIFNQLTSIKTASLQKCSLTSGHTLKPPSHEIT